MTCSPVLRLETYITIKKGMKQRLKDIEKHGRVTIKTMKNIMGKNSGKIISSGNGKMPGYTQGTSALFCQIGAKLRKNNPNSSCAVCYVFKGNFRFDTVQKGLKQASFAVEFFEKQQDYSLWVESLSNRIKQLCIIKKTYLDGKIIAEKDNRWFRFHDSGDIQSEKHLTAINTIAILNPDVKFWIPTREIKFVKAFLKNNQDFADNLCVRISCMTMKEGPKDYKTGLTTSTIDYSEATDNCIAPMQGGSCDGELMSCRKCWDRSVPNTNYKLH